MSDDWKIWLFFGVIICCLIITIKEFSDCSDKGGTYIKNAFGFYECVKVQRIN